MNEYLIDKLSTLFTPKTVLQLDNEVITRIAGESEQSVEERLILDKKMAALREAQKIGYRMHRHKPQGTFPLPQPEANADNFQDLALRPNLFVDAQVGESD